MMTEIEFIETKDKVYGLAERSLFFYGFPEKLARLKEQLNILELNDVSEQVLREVVDFFEKTNKEIPEQIRATLDDL